MFEPSFYNEVVDTDGYASAYEQLVSDLYQFKREQSKLDETQFYMMTVNHIGVPVIRPVTLDSIKNYIYFQEEYDAYEDIRPRSFHYLDSSMNLHMISIRHVDCNSDELGSYTNLELVANNEVVGYLTLVDGR